MKSGVGMYGREGGWYSVAIVTFPVIVITSMASKSEIKSSYSLCCSLCFIAMAVPSCWLLVVLFLCILYPGIFRLCSFVSPWLFISIMSGSYCRYMFDSPVFLVLQWSTLCCMILSVDVIVIYFILVFFVFFWCFCS